MSTDRRGFLRHTAAAVGTLALGATPDALAAAHVLRPTPPAKRAIRILILGGTGFIGPYQVRYALER
ncbi:MAG: twin-arginine translocation signal domain-containing protein, partial [Candidatus Poribacteria bacterium]